MTNNLQQKQLIKQLTHFWSNNLPFNTLLGLQISKFDCNTSEIRFLWQDKLMGNPLQKTLHGGVTASALDFAGGVVVAANMIEQLEHKTPAAIQQSLSCLGTIDLRTDYLRPGRGEAFIATAHIIRSGNKVAVARMELHNEKGDHIAFGTGTYLVG
ncbi:MULTISPECIES: thioesterase family protein [unclassified Colwellia]|uniref:thioesterase family protein n=1 Tax=unclassified Colwellia TaxID=196834 RepID=UPI0015F38F9D|nr:MULTISPECIES: thioesterase family protein [unclassified Colwellia]MBA6231234.1 thioesterase family protein [Colwellia sp. MB02u-7]MBA6238342.1 thioesterase family protein [Colwellia sp. MB02u-11]MBA6255116.1 thioesterase family protein [Colwellia sp. MB3u-28]MBA6260691.1 thioesterase family protein [Colwellia sp. MB3u-41]MBA6299063.1 thioesterase family protein [Colwellia sp. MB3u-22]